MSEVKFGTITGNGTFDYTLANTFSLLPNIMQGPGKYQRIGNRIKYKNLQMRVAINMEDLGVPVGYNPTLVRVIIYQTRSALVTTPPGYTDIVDDPSNWQSSLESTTSRHMYDKTFELAGPTLAANQHSTAPSYYNRKFNFRLGNNVLYNDNTATLPTQPKNLYYMTILTNRFGGTGNQARLRVESFMRMSFVDI